MIKLGIIGAGKIVKEHILAAEEAGFLPVAIVARNNSMSAFNFSKDNPNIEPCLNINDFLQKDLDAILIATTEESKAEVLIRAIEKNKPILIEKPVYSRSNYDKLKNLKKLELVKVAYNRRNYSSIERFKQEMQKINNGTMQLNLPELSWVTSPPKKLVYEMAYTNSIHIIDLLNYLISNFKIIKIIKHRNTKNFNRLVLFENNKFIGIINFTFGIADTYSIKLQSDNVVLELDPIEVFKSYKKITKTKESHNTYYTKKTNTTWEMNENDKRFKPGFFRQYIEFKKFINSPKSEVNLATMLDDRKAFEIMNQILGSVEK